MPADFLEGGFCGNFWDRARGVAGRSSWRRSSWRRSGGGGGGGLQGGGSTAAGLTVAGSRGLGGRELLCVEGRGGGARWRRRRRLLLLESGEGGSQKVEEEVLEGEGSVGGDERDDANGLGGRGEISSAGEGGDDVGGELDRPERSQSAAAQERGEGEGRRAQPQAYEGGEYPMLLACTPATGLSVSVPLCLSAVRRPRPWYVPRDCGPSRLAIDGE